MAIRIAIVDDHQLFRAGLRALLAGQSQVEVVADASITRAPGILTGGPRPDVIVLGWTGLPDPTVAPVLREASPEARVLVLGSGLYEDEAARAGELGFDGYASKDSAVEDLLRAIGEVLGRRFELDDRPPLGGLTAREREVFTLVVRGLRTEQIAARLGISPRTVETHRSRILHKLQSHSASDLVRLAARHGLLGG